MSLTSLKRVTRELVDLIPSYKNIDITYDNNKIILKIRNICLIIPNTYPFNAPDVEINKLHYGRFVVSHSSRINQYINCQKDGSCLCCKSIIKNSRNLWSPALSIRDIMNEIEGVNIIKRKIKYSIALEDISKNIQKKIKKDIPHDIENNVLSFLI
jgi:ubiquitin-protein ligase